LGVSKIRILNIKKDSGIGITSYNCSMVLGTFDRESKNIIVVFVQRFKHFLV